MQAAAYSATTSRKKGADPKADPHFSTATAPPATSRANPEREPQSIQKQQCTPFDLLASKIGATREGTSWIFSANRRI